MATFIEQLRKKGNFSQDDLAKLIGVSRPIFAQIEKEEKDLTISQAKKLAELFDLSMNDFLAKRIPKEPQIIIEKPKAEKKAKAPDIRISVPQKNLKKFKEVLLYILEKVGAKPNVGETVVYKLLYFIDFDFYEKYEKQLIGATYIKNHFGPTPVEFAKIVEQMQTQGEIERVRSKHFQYDQKKYLPLRPPNLNELTVCEKEHIDNVLIRLSDKNAAELSEYSHNDVPWLVHEDGEIISYESVFYRSAPHAQRDYEAMWQSASAQDILHELGDMSQEEYEYYLNLPPKK